MSKSSSPPGYIWHVDQVSQTPGRVGLGASRPAKVWGGSAHALVATRLHEEEKPESVEKVGGGRSNHLAGHVAWPSGHHLAPNQESVEVAFTPINTSLAGRPARCWCHFNFHFANVSRMVGARGIWCPKWVEAELGIQPATCTSGRPGFGELPLQISGGAHSTYKYPTYP
jgi:hypothetical protein